MSAPGELERKTQNRLIALFRDQLGYAYYGDWTDRDNSNIETEILLRWLTKVQKYDLDHAKRAVSELSRASTSGSPHLYDRNRAVYDLLRYGVKVKADVAEQHQTLWLIDWEHPERNEFAVAEEVTILGSNTQSSAKRPDLVLYVNGIALGVIELKRSIVSVSEGIRQNLDSQKPQFIENFFSTIQLVCAGNDTEGLRYGVIGTTEKFYLTWKEPSDLENPLDRAVGQMFEKARFLELIHDFLTYDVGVKKVCRPHQYFGVRAAEEFVARREGGIIWHAQGTGKSLTMLWLARWIREHVHQARVLIITDRIELDEQIERIFLGVNEDIKRAESGAKLVGWLNSSLPWLMCSLIHKFGGAGDDDAEPDVEGFVAELRKAIPADFVPKGNFVVFVDECHRTQSNILHDAMKSILPNATFIGFTGTPLLRTAKKTSLERFGRYIHTYKFDEAVADKVILDLRYEARDIDQRLVSQERIDAWFEAKTKGLTTFARAQIKHRWGTLQEVFSSRSRLNQIVQDILLDMATKDRLVSDYGNAILVSDSIYNACKLYELFAAAGMRKTSAIVTSYRPTPASLKGEDAGEGDSERFEQYEIYRKMLAAWFNEPEDVAVTKADIFEKQVKDKFIHEPGAMKLLIVVNKLLTGFDAPPATYLYIDKSMEDHGLFQAICRVNRLDTPDKEYGYIVDYRDLFKSLRQSVLDYTSGALSGYDPADVTGLLKNRLAMGRKDLNDTLEAVKGLCEPVPMPRASADYLHYFCAQASGSESELEENQRVRVALYKLVGHLVRAYADIANEMDEAGYTPYQIARIKADVDHFEKVREEVKLASGDYVDLKIYEPAMRHLIDTFITADASQKISSFDDIGLVELIVKQGPDAVDRLPPGLRKDPGLIGETIENNVRKLLVDKNPINPRYYDAMSKLLDEIIRERREAAIDYAEYLRKITDLARRIDYGPDASTYPMAIDTPARRAIYDNTGRYETTAIELDTAIRSRIQDDWRNNVTKTKRVRFAIAGVLGVEASDPAVEKVLELAKMQRDY
jgi:type I restriction enzyme R subunit